MAEPDPPRERDPAQDPTRETAPAVLLLGLFLSAHGGRRAVIEDVDERLRLEGVRTLRASSRTGGARRSLDMLAAVVRHRRAYGTAVLDVYSGRAFLWAEASGRALARLGKPTLMVLRGGGLADFAERWPRRVSSLLSRAARVVSPSTYLADRLGERGQAVEYLPNGIDVACYPLREASSGGGRMVWLRAFSRTYQPELAVLCLSRVRRRFPAATLTMIGPDLGDGSLDGCRRLARELGVDGAVSFPGPVPKGDVPRALREHDVFLNTTRLESFGVSTLEAALSGLSIVSTDAGELPRLWTSGRDALLFPVGDADGAAAAVVSLLEDPALAARLSAAARSRAEGFDWSRLWPRWRDAILGLPS